MMAARELLALRQEGIKMAAPACRVFAAAQALRLGRIQNALDTTAQARGSFGPRQP